MPQLIQGTGSGDPVFAQVIDRTTGTIRVDGNLTVQGADLLRGAVEALRSVQISVAAAGGELVVNDPPHRGPKSRP